MTDAERMEQLAQRCHEIYQQEAIRQDDKRYPFDYETLPENIKEYDRVLARYILQREAALRRVVEAAQNLIADRHHDEPPSPETNRAVEVCEGAWEDLKEALDALQDKTPL